MSAEEMKAWLDLQPFQRELVERIYSDERVTLAGGRAANRRFMQDCMAAAAINAGDLVYFAAMDPESAEAARQRALAVLDRFDELQAGD